MEEDDAFVPIPGLSHADVGVVQSLLDAAGFDYHVHDGFGDCPDIVLIRVTDLPAVKELLSQFEVRGPRDDRMPIPW
jgi:hypothetical protein